MRKGLVEKRELRPDPKYNDVLVSRFVNSVMLEGKKSIAYKIFYGTIDKVGEKTGEDGIEVWRKALDNVCPSVEVKRRRMGGSTSQVPVEISPHRKISLGIKWIIKQARLRGEKTMIEKLSNEIIDASKGEGKAYKKKVEMHKVASANRMFAHYKI
jgi:small subunit ribosomal protein S7